MSLPLLPPSNVVLSAETERSTLVKPAMEELDVLPLVLATTATRLLHPCPPDVNVRVPTCNRALTSKLCVVTVNWMPERFATKSEITVANCASASLDTNPLSLPVSTAMVRLLPYLPFLS